MTLEEIKAAVRAGKTVYWKNHGYTVVGDRDDFLIIWRRGLPGEHCIGLTWNDGVTMNGEPEDFFLGTPASQIEFQTFMVVSTSHVPQTTRDWLDMLVRTGSQGVKEGPSLIVDDVGSRFGYRIHLPDEDVEVAMDEGLRELHPELSNLIALAKSHRAHWLQLDRDGNELNDWPTFD